MSSPQEIGLKKALGFWWLYTLAIGAVVGDGIFTFTGYAVASAGPSSIIAYIIAGVTQMFIMISFGELAVWRPTAGGPEPWVRELVSRRLGFLASIAFSIGWIIAGGSVGLAVGTYTYNFFKYSGIDLGDPTLWVALFAILWITIFAILNIIGVTIAAGTQFILTITLIGLMTVYAISATFHIDPKNYEPFMPHGLEGFWGAIPIGVYAYMGASTVLFAGEEAKRPVDVARVLFWSSLTFILLYTWALTACIGTLTYEEVNVFYEAIYAQSAMKIWGPVAAIIINFGAWLAAATCLLMGTMYQPARDLYNLARLGYRLPRWFSYVHPRFRTPINGIIFTWIISVILIVLGTVAGQTLGYMLLGYELVWGWSISFLLTTIAAINFRRRYPDEVKKLPWRMPLWPATPVIAFIGIGLTIFAMFYDLTVSYGAEIATIMAVISLLWIVLLGYVAKYILPREEVLKAHA